MEEKIKEAFNRILLPKGYSLQKIWYETKPVKMADNSKVDMKIGHKVKIKFPGEGCTLSITIIIEDVNEIDAQLTKLIYEN